MIVRNKPPHDQGHKGPVAPDTPMEELMNRRLSITRIAPLPIFPATLLLLFALSACNTTQGFGEDVEAAGDAIEETAEEAEDELD